MKLGELKQGAETDNSVQIDKFRNAVRTAILVVSSVVGLLIVTLMVVGVINDNNLKSRAGDVSTTSLVQKTSECPGIPQTFDLAVGEAKTINPNACQLRWKIRTGCVKVLNADGMVTYPRACSGGDEARVPPGIHTVVALNSVKVRRTECGRKATGDNLDSCD